MGDKPYYQRISVPVTSLKVESREKLGGGRSAKWLFQDYPPLLILEVNGMIFRFEDYAIGKIAEAFGAVFDYT